MSWLCVLGLEVWKRASIAQQAAAVSLLTWRGKPLQLKSFSRECAKGRWPLLLSGVTCAPSIARNGVERWMWSLQATRARANPTPVSVEVPPTSAGCGTTSGESFATWERDTSSWRMSPLTSTGRSRKSSPRWPRAGGLRSGTVCPRQPSAPRIKGTGSSCLLPTPTSTDFKASGAAGYSTASGRHAGYTLTDVLVRGLLPSPRARDWKGWGKDCLPPKPGPEGRRLNPRFVEWMMGWPDQWTKTVCTSSATG
jgi:hypothetical protein